MIAVGIPKEIKPGERRVSLTPEGVKKLTGHQTQVFVEKNAGVLSGFSDREYEKAGAFLVEGKEKLWAKAVLIKKVKEPISNEFKLFKPHHIIFTYLHLASPSERPLIDRLIHSQATAIAYETIEKNGETPLLKPMSEVAGVLAAYFAGIFKNHVQIKGTKISGLDIAKSIMEKLASEYPKTPKSLPLGKVAVLGGGRVGKEAARMACAMGGEVFLSEISEEKRKELEKQFQSSGFKIDLINPQDTENYEEVLTSSEIIIAAVHSAGKRAPIVIDPALLGKISKHKKKIILDIAIDQGGNVAESHPTDYEQPLYLDSSKNLRFSVTNIPSLCGRGASLALEKVSLEYTIALSRGLDEAIGCYPELRSGINVLRGIVTHPAIQEAHQLGQFS